MKKCLCLTCQNTECDGGPCKLCNKKTCSWILIKEAPVYSCDIYRSNIKEQNKSPEQQLKSIRKLLPDDFSNDKSWREGGIIERILWLTLGYKGKCEELEDVWDMLNKCNRRDNE